MARFEQLLRETLEAKTIWRKWPLLAVGEDGAVMSGIADLVIETHHRSWVIDHKSDRVTDPREAMLVYFPQLEAYAEMLERAGHSNHSSEVLAKPGALQPNKTAS